jgi:hypothetical protein
MADALMLRGRTYYIGPMAVPVMAVDEETDKVQLLVGDKLVWVDAKKLKERRAWQ